MATPASTSRLAQTVANSTAAWQADLEALFHRAKDRFPDVVWDLVSEQADDDHDDEVWGHKAIVYARAPPSFQARYFTLRNSLRPYSPSGYPTQSALSLSLGIDIPSVSRSPSPFRPASPMSTTEGGITRLTTAINPTLFSKELEYLYTGKDFGEAFEFLFDSSEHSRDPSESRVDKLRKDLVFMWRSRLYSDVRISIEGSHSAHHEGTTAVFSTHRFMLVSRSTYFHNALIAWPSAKADSADDTEDIPTLTLPALPFTPPALHFILGFIYTGTLIFSNRTYDLDTSFHILRSSAYLSLDTLYAEIEARIVHDMMHGLYQAFLEFAEYEAATGGKWGGGGCRCRQCARRVPRVLEFALLDDVKNATLERGARRALVGLFGDGWCYAEFAKLDKRVRDQALKGVAKRTTPMNIVPLLLAANAALARLDAIIEPWADVVRDMVVEARKVIDTNLAMSAEEFFNNYEWDEIMHADGDRFEDSDIADQVLQSLRRGFSDKTAGALYQTLVSSVLLRPAPNDASKTMLSPTSQIRALVEDTRVDLIRWLRKRWIGVRQEGGFDDLEGWALKEISHEIEVPTEDLQSTSPSARGTIGRSGVRSTAGKPPADDGDTVSMHSLRASVLNRQMAKHHVSNTNRDSSASSIRSVARSVTSTVPSRVNVPRRTVPSRPDSKLTPSSTFVRRSPSPTASTTINTEKASESNNPTSAADTSATPTPPSEPPAAKRPRTSTEPSARPKSSASSIVSVRSKASTVRTTRNVSVGQSTPATTARTPSRTGTAPRNPNTLSIPDTAMRTRRASAASTLSAASVKTTGSTTKVAVRPRPPSAASMRSPTGPSSSTNTSTTSRVVKKPPVPVPPLDSATKASPIAHRTVSTSSMKSTASVKSTASASLSPSTKKSVARKVTPVGKPLDSGKSTPTSGTSTIKGKGKGKGKAAVGGGESGSTAASMLLRKGSADTIKRGMPAAAGRARVQDEYSSRGARLEVGIPCIISSKRARFRAYARYIGEVDGEAGPWVGVEVPMGDTWPGEKIDGRAWHDGTWGGVRYFDLVGETEWGEPSMESVSRRYRSTLGKREGEQLAVERAKRLRSVSPAVSDATNTAETRGLFVRPQQVLYVVDAVGADL